MSIPALSHWLAVAMVVLSLSATAATVDVPEFVEVQSINGAEPGSRLLQRQRQYELPAGSVLIELRYNDVQPSELGDSHTNFRSAAVAIRFQASVDGRYLLQGAQPTSERAATAFSAAPFFRITEHGSALALPQQFYSAADLKMAKVPPLPAAGPVTRTEASPLAPPAAAAGLAAQNLWFWWQQADDAARQDFLRRIGR